jgi:hypothetical protein
VAINLEPARHKVESFMTETCDVIAPGAVHTATVDPVTLELIYPDAVKLYSAGACKIKDIMAQSSRGGTSTSAEGGNQLLIVGTKIDFPIGEVGMGFPEGSLIICLSSLRMPQMVGAHYLMRQPSLKTFAIQYSVMADRRKQVDP